MSFYTLLSLVSRFLFRGQPSLDTMGLIFVMSMQDGPCHVHKVLFLLIKPLQLLTRILVNFEN